MLKSGVHDDSFYQEMWAVLLEKGEWQGEVWDKRKNGEIYADWLTISSVVDEGGRTTHYVATQADMTHRKAAEARIEKITLKSDGTPSGTEPLDVG
jgi:PAS domain-containing protein